MSSLLVNVQNLITRIGTEFKNVRTDYNGKVGTLGSLSTTDKTSLVAALNEVRAQLVAGGGGSSGAAISDGSTATTSTWSSQKITDQITAAITAVVNGAPTAFDTLKELADAMAADQSGIAALTTALDNRVRWDAAQTLTAPQKAQARTNIDAYGSVEIGDPTTDLVALFTAAIA